MKENIFLKFKDGDLELDVKFSPNENTAWLSQKEMALLFDVSVDNISLHIKNIIKEGRLNNALFEESSVVQTEGNRKVTRKIKYYNFDMILAVGYRTKSNRVTRFKDWVNERLKEFSNESKLQKPFSCANNYEIVKFENGSISLDINVAPNEDTVWLTKEQMSILFGRDRSVISRHIDNIYKENELEKESTCAKNAHILDNRERLYEIELYNLDVVLSVGYRVNSKRGIEFRRWANKILKDYLIKGYSINNKRCLEHSDILNNISNEIIKIKNENNKQIESINKKIDILDEKVKENTKELEIINASEKLINGTLIYEGNVYKAYSFIKDLFLKAYNRLIIVDGYVDKSVLDMLDDISIDITIYTYPSANLTNTDINKFKINHKLNVIKQNKLHARFIIIDNDIYQISESIKDVGKKRFVSNKIDFITVDELLNKIKK